MNKTYIISWIITSFLVIAWGAYYATVANLDYTCYNYTKTSSCSISTKTYLEAKATSWVNCTAWNNWKSICSWNIWVDTYTRWASYRCSNRNADARATVTIPGQAWQVEDTDTIAPTVTWWWIE